MEADLTDTHFVSPGAASNESTLDEYAANPRFQQLQTELRSWLVVGASSRDQTRENSASPPDTSRAATRHKPGYQHLWEHVKNSADQIPLKWKIKYLHVWITECAPWLDMFDNERHFGLQVPIIAQKSPAVFHALLALAARTAERRGYTQGSRDSLELYSQAISSLTSSLNTKEPNVMVTACILCVLEMMSVSPRDWRRHVEGCAALFASSGINGFSGGLLQAVFWCYARMDLCGAIIADGSEATTHPIEKWALLPDFSGTEAEKQEAIMAEFLKRGRQIPDMYANCAVYLCAKVCDLLARRTRCVELGEENGCNDESFEQEWNKLWSELQGWYTHRPPEMTPVKEIKTGAGGSPFPMIFFPHWAAISSNQLYHTACILMLEIMNNETLDKGKIIHSSLWHARRVVGISLTNPHPGCINNAIQPLHVAGKLFTHFEEHSIIVKLIDSIEARTGWGSRWRIKDLEATWGYCRGTFT
ncbi:uncharacterized protein Z519_01434 [Cladophialophora bantiana CBS 173.52]|uniref:Transcription factor domain-containing protein n=1 Tax=Cladophialophora bantiana (strain ATCC 10958 / CBS 173.52 / CDC B-1940 / NIH 8579) TaxID=1442370 RepID=A0A0D2I3Q1_CLAB1|nr:uncharacterized protein Z519_01434 [Cladophialophora bantiana CBS 173.52]KIW97850.1 hypothetical protein Z519_01434 [Cladophialophora bantiana CBS 173.52]